MVTATPSSHQETVRQKCSSKCQDHRQKDVVFVCKDCKMLLCITCGIKSVHKTHNLEELSDVAQEKKAAIVDFVNQSENSTLPRLKDDLISNDHQMTETSSEFTKISTEMKLQGEKCKHEIYELLAGFTLICEEMERSNLELLRHQKEDKQHRYDVVLSEVEECKKALQTGRDVEIFDTDFDTLGRFTKTNPPVIQTCKYTPCTTITDHLKQAIGKFNPDSTDHSQPTAAAKSTTDTSYPIQEGSVCQPEIETAFTSVGMSTVHYPSCELLDESVVVSNIPCSTKAWSMCTTPEGYLWVLDCDRKTVLQISDEGKTKQKIVLDSYTRDISVFPETGRLWFCCEDRTIYELQKSATPVPQFKTKHKPLCLCITNDGVIVGTLSRLTIYTPSGSVLHTIINGEKTDFFPPFKISNCSVTENKAVVHGSENKRSKDVPYPLTMHIAVYDRTLNHLFTYRGEGIRGQQPVTPQTFGPFRIVYDSFGNLIVADVKRDTIEVLGGTGHYMKTLHSGPELRHAICIGSGNTLCYQLEDDEGNTTINVLKYCK